MGPLDISIEGCPALVRVLHLDVDDNLTPSDALSFIQEDDATHCYLAADEPRKKAQEAQGGLILDGRMPQFLVALLLGAARNRPMVAVHAPQLPADPDLALTDTTGSCAVVVHSDPSRGWPAVGTRLRFPQLLAKPHPAHAETPRYQWRDEALTLIPSLPIRLLTVEAPRTSPEAAATSLAQLREEDAQDRVVMVDGARALWHVLMVTDRLVELGARAIAITTVRSDTATVIHSRDASLPLGAVVPQPHPPRRGQVIFFGASPRTGKSLLTNQLAQALVGQGFPAYRLPAAPDGEGTWFFALPRRLSTPLRRGTRMTRRFLEARLQSIQAARRNMLLVLLDPGGIPSEENRHFLEASDAAVWMARTGDGDLSQWESILPPGKPVMARLLVDDSNPPCFDMHVDRWKPTPSMHGTLYLQDGQLGPPQGVSFLAAFLAWHPVLRAPAPSSAEQACRLRASLQALEAQVDANDSLGALASLGCLLRELAPLFLMEPGRWDAVHPLHRTCRWAGWPFEAAWEAARLPPGDPLQPIADMFTPQREVPQADLLRQSVASWPIEWATPKQESPPSL